MPPSRTRRHHEHQTEQGPDRAFLVSIDWIQLGKQKETLVEQISQRTEALEDLADTDPTIEDLTGILHLIDGLQDFFDAYLPEPESSRLRARPVGVAARSALSGMRPAGRGGPVTPNRLMRLSITTFVTVLVALLLTLFFTADNAATQRCIDKGNSAEFCGWR